MASWRLRQSYGFGAGRVPLAPVFTPGPFSSGDSLADDLAALAEELESIDRRALARRAAAALGLAVVITLALVLATPRQQERDTPIQDLVLIEPEPVAPEPEPEPEVAPEPPPPVEVAKADPTPPPPPPPMAKPKPKLAPPPPPPVVKPPPAAKPPPPPVQAEPVRPPPQLKIDAIAKAPEPAPAVPQQVVRGVPPPKTPTMRIDPVAPSFAVAATAPPAGQAAPLRAAARTPARPPPPVQFALGPVPAAPAETSPSPAPIPRAAPRAEPARSAPSAMPRFDPVAPPPTQYTAPATKQTAVERVVRTAAREETPAAAPKKAFQGVPLGSLAACVSDREEDSLKLEVMKAAGTRTSCSSRAGNYRFVETKNLNAFLMWIERNPSRKAADRCIELKLALECLAAT